MSISSSVKVEDNEYRIGGALKMLEKVFKYPDIETDRVKTTTPCGAILPEPVLERAVSAPGLNSDFLRKQKALMNNDML
jgi:hypothetical protein